MGSSYLGPISIGRLDMDAKSVGRPRIPSEKKRECLELFEKGNGYKRTASLTGLNAYTVRDYRRRYASGDTSWAYGMK